MKTYLIESALYENYANIYGNSNGILQNTAGENIFLIESALYENYSNIYGNSNGILQNIMIWDSANSWI